ncbi:MAG: SipW-dependent-type signal peptide-containing protein, partial [Dehalococcoidales bacterium]|nr:SipW-dependent-type signal peptide-containing protein [Dehalococcoidales bacterium]
MLRQLFDIFGPPGSLVRKAAGIGIAFFVLLAFGAGSTWAYMSDAETSGENTVTAGTLDLVIEVYGTYNGTGAWYVTPGGNGINGRVGYDYIAADDTGSIAWVLSNAGNISGTLTISSVFTFLDYSGVGQGSMGDNLMVNLQRGT